MKEITTENAIKALDKLISEQRLTRLEHNMFIECLIVIGNKAKEMDKLKEENNGKKR